MTTKIHSLDDLFLEELGDLYSAETQLVNAIPKMAEATSSSQLRLALAGHWEETKNQIKRLEEIFESLNQKPYAITCKAMKGLIDEGEEVIKHSEKGAARDAAIIGAAQRVEHYEISAYGTAQSHAALLGFSNVSELLSQTLEEEKAADTHLNDLALDSINLEAKLT